MSGEFNVATSEAIFDGAEQHVSEKYPNMETMWPNALDDFMKGARWGLSKADKHLTELYDKVVALEEQLDKLKKEEPKGRKQKHGK